MNSCCNGRVLFLCHKAGSEHFEVPESNGHLVPLGLVFQPIQMKGDTGRPILYILWIGRKLNILIPNSRY